MRITFMQTIYWSLYTFTQSHQSGDQTVIIGSLHHQLCYGSVGAHLFLYKKADLSVCGMYSTCLG